MEFLRADTSVDLLETMYALKMQLDLEKIGIVQSIYVAVGNENVSSRRRVLLRVKRNVYNLQPSTPDALSVASATLTARDSERLRIFHAKLHEYIQIQTKLEKTFEDELKDIRKKFHSYLEDDFFQKGLLLSSPTLFKAQAKYVVDSSRGLSGRQEKIERGLMRYYSRMAMKATPFGTFCTILHGCLKNGDGSRNTSRKTLEFIGDLKRTSVVRINKDLYTLLWEYMRTQSSIKNQLYTRLNPTIVDDKFHYHFLADVQGKELFQSLSSNPVIEVIRNKMEELECETVIALAQNLAKHEEIEATKEDSLEFLDQLIEIGFLQFCSEIHESDPDWDLSLCTVLDGIRGEQAQRAASLLRELREMSERYALAPAEQRKKLMDEVSALVANSLESMDIQAKLGKGLLFYEDTTAAAAIELSQDKLAKAIEELQAFIAVTRSLAWPRTEQIAMRHFFDAFYGKKVSAVPLLTFYEDYYREHFKSHLEIKQEIKSGGNQTNQDYDLNNPFNLDIVSKINEAKDALRKLIANRWMRHPGAEEINISLQDLEEVTQGVGMALEKGYSHTVFADVVIPQTLEGNARLVLSGKYFAGYGKYFSRFLCLFPDEISASIIESNAALTKSKIAEISEDGNFNGNLHPPLTEFEIVYPNGKHGLAPGKIKSTKLHVARDSSDPYSLCLCDGLKGERVIPIDTGFLNPLMRPPLYQLLTHFMPAANFWMWMPLRPLYSAETIDSDIDEKLEIKLPENVGKHQVSSDRDTSNRDAGVVLEAQIVHRPRVTFNKYLVLSRRCWFIPATLFPNRQPSETMLEYFSRVHEWRIVHDIPSEVYVRVRLLHDNMGNSAETWDSNKDMVREARVGANGSEAHKYRKREAERKSSSEGFAPGTNLNAQRISVAKLGQGDEETGSARNGRHKKRISHDFRKPQFIDFSNPLLVALFGNIAVNLEKYEVIVEECLPSADELLQHEGKRYVTELILQFNSNSE